MTEMPEPTRYGEAIWLEPFPDVLLEGIPDQAPGPEARYETKEAIELGFIVGLQHLSPPQRAVLVLRDVLGYHAEEVAEMLETTAQSVNSLLRRARAAFESRLPAAGRERAPLTNSKRERDTVGRFADAIQTGDIESLVALLTDDAWLTMPPEPYEYQGPAAIGSFLSDRTITRGAPLLVSTRANTHPAFGATSHPPDRDRSTVRNGRPDPRGPTDLRDHLVWRQRLPAVRAAADAPIGKRSPGTTPGLARRGAPASSFARGRAPDARDGALCTTVLILAHMSKSRVESSLTRP